MVKITSIFIFVKDIAIILNLHLLIQKLYHLWNLFNECIVIVGYCLA